MHSHRKAPVILLLLSCLCLPSADAFGLSTLNALTTRFFSSPNSDVGIADPAARASFEEFEVLKSEGLLTKSDIGTPVRQTKSARD